MILLFKYHKILVLMAIFIVIGCSSFQPYETYKAPEDSLFLIEFDYPADWSWQVDARGHVIAFDPNGKGDFSVFVHEKETLYEIIVDMNQSMQASFLFGADRDAYITFEPIEISGYSAKHITLNLPANPRQGHKKPRIQETYYMVIGNRLHMIGINIDKDQRNGAFGRGFDHVIKTIKVIEPLPAP
jgi:hypothetical protein